MPPQVDEAVLDEVVDAVATQRDNGTRGPEEVAAALQLHLLLCRS
jgi:hypothetical protein